MKKRGRPRVEIDKGDFEKLCSLFCTEEDIAYFFNCSIDTISRWCKRTYGNTFADTYKRFKTRGKVSLRRMQWQSAEKGNVSMQIWLGKQELNQRENPEDW